MNTQNKTWEDEIHYFFAKWCNYGCDDSGACEEAIDYIKKNFVHKDEVKDKHNCKREGCIPIEEVIEEVS